MDPLFWLWLVGLGVPIVMWLSRPWRAARSSSPISEEEHLLSELLARREAIMDALAELEVDFRAGKLSPEDYQVQKAALMEQGAAVLKALDELQSRLAQEEPEVSVETVEEGAVPSVPEEVPSPSVQASSDDDIEALLQARRRAQMARYVGFCPSCGGALRAGQRFCPLCGHEVSSSLRRKSRKRRRTPSR